MQQGAGSKQAGGRAEGGREQQTAGGRVGGEKEDSRGEERGEREGRRSKAGQRGEEDRERQGRQAGARRGTRQGREQGRSVHKQSVLLVMAASCLAVLGLAVLAGGGQSLTVDNTKVRLDTNGNGINAHDGHILIDGNGTYWLFGTRYPDCLESQDHCGWGMGPLWPNGTSRDPS